MKRAICWQITKRLTGSTCDLPYHGLILRCQTNSHSATRAIYFSGLPDYREMRFMMDYLRPGDHFIDAGANIGLYTLLARTKVGATGYVHAIEPRHEWVQLLQESVQRNGFTNVEVHLIGLADQDGSADFVKTNHNPASHIKGMASPVSITQIPISRLDRLLPDVPYAMAKFDVEGYEPFAVRGASTWLKQGNPPVMLIEMAGYSRRHGINTPDFIAELDKIGYFTAVYDPDTKALIKTLRHWEIPAENVLAISKKREAFVEERLKSNGKLHIDALPEGASIPARA